VELQNCLFDCIVEKTDKKGDEIFFSFGQKSQKMSPTLLTRSSSPQRRNYENRPNLGISFTINTDQFCLKTVHINFSSFLVVRIGIKTVWQRKDKKKV